MNKDQPLAGFHIPTWKSVSQGLKTTVSPPSPMMMNSNGANETYFD